MADYGDQTKERPYIFPQNVEAAFHLLDGGNADPDGGYVFRNLIIRSDKSTEFGFRMLNDVDDVVIDNMHIEGFRIGVYVGGVGPLNPGANNSNERITLKNSTIINNYGQGWLGGGDDHLIENNVFENNGSQAVFDHNIYLNSPIREVAVTNMTVRGNTLYKSTQVGGLCQGVSLVAHGKIDNLTIENNLIKEDKGAVKASCWGISVDPGYPTEEAFNNLVIRGNTLINVGNTGIGCASCSGVVIEDNDIIDESNTLRWGIRVPVRDEDSLKSDNVKIASNTVVLSHEQANGIYLGGENQFVAVSNTITQPSNTNADCIFKTGANSTTDTSSNTCSKHTDVTFIDNETGEPVDSTESIVGSVLVDNETETEAAPLRTEEPATTESLAVVVESSNELTEEDYAKHEERIKARERSPRGTTDSSTTTTVEDVNQATETTQSTTDVESCRAWSRGRCLMR
mgnify:CR=1 FL=1